MFNNCVKKDYFDFLKKVYFFASLSDDDIRTILSVCIEEEYDAGKIIFYEGTIGDRCSILLKGRVEIWKDYQKEERDLLAEYRTGQLFGELALIDDFPRSATVVACEPVRLLSIRRDDFNKVIAESSSISVSIMRSISLMVRERTDTFVYNLRAGKQHLKKAYEQLKKEAEERTQLEAQLYQAQKMESIGTLAGGIAHDFNNILCAIFGYAEIALGNIKDKNDENYRCLMEIIKSSQRARELVRQILTFSRQSEVERKPLKIQYIINEVLNLIRSSLPSTIKIVKNIDKECEPVMADPTQIHQIIMNLCTNAYHAMESRNGVLKVSLDTVKTNITEKNLPPDMPSGSYLRIRVGDTGRGINPDVIKRIFDPYFTTKERGKGTGLGLSIVHGIVKKHNGYISVQSESDKGTEFNIYLPVIKFVPHFKRPEIYNTDSVAGNERILLVDDEHQIVQMMQKVLEDLGYNVKARTSSIEALHAFRANPDNFAIVVTDQTMPNMTGETLAKEILLIRPDIPVILCTGFSEIITREKIKEIGIRELVMKPVVTSEIAGIIRRILDNPC